jgi:hypothetical protein
MELSAEAVTRYRVVRLLAWAAGTEGVGSLMLVLG